MPRCCLLLHRLVLVALAIVLQLEEIGEILGLLTATAAAALLFALLHLNVAIERVGALQLAQRALLARQRPAAVAHAELLLGALHLLGRRDERLADLREDRVLLRDAALEQTLRERRDLLAQAALCDRERGRVLVALALDALGAVAHPVEGAGHDVALPLHEIAGVLPAAATAAASTARLRFAIVARPGAHLEEVDVAQRLMSGRVARDRVVGNEVAGLESHLLEEQRVRGLRLLRRLGERDERDRALLAAVHAIAKLERCDTVIVARLGLDRDLLERRDLGVAPRIRDAHFGRAVIEHFDGILHTAADSTPVGRLEIDAIEATPAQREAPAQLAGRISGERDGPSIVERERAAAHRARDGRLDDDHGPRDGGDVAAVLLALRRAAGEGREAQLDRELRDRGEVGDTQTIGLGADAHRFHVVLGQRDEIEESSGELRLGGVAPHGNARPLGRAVRAEDEFGAVGREVRERGADVERAAARHIGIARLDVHDGRRRGRRDSDRPGREEALRRVAKARRTEQEQEGRRDDRAGEELPRAQLARTFDGARIRDRRERARGLVDDARGERGRGPLLHWLAEFVHGGDQRLPQSWRAVLHVERELGVARASHEG